MSQPQVVPEGATLARPSLKHHEAFKDTDPELYRATQDVVGALRQDMIPAEVQEELFKAMNAGVQRSLVAEAAGLDASILMTFKQQITLVDAILRRTFNDDGTLSSLSEESLAMSPKDALNLSLKVSQMMVKELPKVYSMERIQRVERALLKVMSEHMTREQQESFLEVLEEQKQSL